MKDTFRLLLIDDDTDDALILREAMEGLNLPFEYIHEIDCVRALAALRENTIAAPHVIFLDLNMPKLDGLQCLTHIKKMDFYKDVPIIIYSTSAAPHDIAQAYRLGGSYFLTKPNNLKSLQEKAIGNISNALVTKKRVHQLVFIERYLFCQKLFLIPVHKNTYSVRW